MMEWPDEANGGDWVLQSVRSVLQNGYGSCVACVFAHEHVTPQHPSALHSPSPSWLCEAGAGAPSVIVSMRRGLNWRTRGGGREEWPGRRR